MNEPQRNDHWYVTAHSRWSAFWFQPTPPASLLTIRRLLCLITAVYFASAMSDVSVWYVSGAPASSLNLAEFFRTAELESDARWMVSPLFIWDQWFAGTALGGANWVYQTYLMIGVVLAIAVATADQRNRLPLPRRFSRLLGSSWPSVLLWVWMIGWANRTVLLAGVVEPVLSLSLAALAIAPMATVYQSDAGGTTAESSGWRVTLSRRLLAVQATLVGLFTTATMLAGATWWNGTGAYALVAPGEDRLSLIRSNAFKSLFEQPLVYESVTWLLVLLLPLGIILAWRQSTSRLGKIVVFVWCGLVAVLSANILYAATLAVVSLAIGDGDEDLSRVESGHRNVNQAASEP